MRQSMSVLIIFFLCAVTAVGQTAPEAAPRLVFNTPITHSDWMLREGVAWGPEGVRHMLDSCKAAGIYKVHWRALDGGRSLYKSALMDPQGKWDSDNFWNPQSEDDKALLQRYSTMSEADRLALLAKLERNDYGTFDSLAEAVRYGHEIGIQVYAWLSINEDDHAWGLVSRFSREHPEMRWRKRDDTAYHSQLSFAYPEVMEYKLAIVREILDNYDVDGLFIDWLRTGDVRDNPQTDADGVADHGYEPPLVEGFTSEFGVSPFDLPNGDERWVQYRARPHTEFMRSVRELSEAKRPGLPVVVLGANPWCYRGFQDRIDGNLRGLLIDVAAWAREGLVDAVLPAGYYTGGGDATSAFKAAAEETAGNAEPWYYAWFSTDPEAIRRDVNLARDLGAREILFWEGDYIDGAGDKAALQAAMRELSAQPRTVVCLGDSITRGVHLAPRETYPAQLQRLLGPQWRVINAGGPGNTVAQGAARLEEDVLAYAPEAVALLFGTNDSVVEESEGVRTPLDQFGREYAALLAHLKEKSIRPIVMTVPPVKPEPYYTRHPEALYAPYGGVNAFIEQYNATIASVASGQEVTVVDLQRLFAADMALIRDEGDGVHPNALGAEAIATAVAEALAR